ncbi:hypothetical protein BpHYR1_026657, partial [Brachionus plicatilis]
FPLTFSTIATRLLKESREFSISHTGTFLIALNFSIHYLLFCPPLHVNKHKPYGSAYLDHRLLDN